jgi:hypothetical protein
MASLRHGRLRIDKLPEDKQTAGLTGEVSVLVKERREEISAPAAGWAPGRVWDRVALASAWEEVTEVPLVDLGAEGVNGWRVSGGV